MESIYFSKENFKRIYKILYINCKKNFNFSIRRRPEYKQRIIDIMKFVYSNKHTYDIPKYLSEEDKSIYLTQKLVNVIIFYESKNHPAHDTGVDETDVIIPSNKMTSLRPRVMSNKDNNNIENNLTALLEARKPLIPKVPEIDFSISNSDFNNINIQDKYSEITKQRETDYDNFSRTTINEPEMKQGDKNLFENMNMTPDNIDMDNILGDYQLLDNGLNSDPSNRLEANYSNHEKNTDIGGMVSGKNPTSEGLVNTDHDIDNRIIIKTATTDVEQKTDTSYIRYQTIIIDCGVQSAESKSRVIEFKDVTDVSGATFEMRLSNTNGGALVRDGWANVVSAEINRVIIPSETDLPFLLVTTDSLPSNITPSENLPQDIFSILYHDNSSTNYSHYINTDGHLQKFEKPTEVFMNRIKFNINKAPTSAWATEPHIIHTAACKLFINIGIRVDHKFDN